MKRFAYVSSVFCLLCSSAALAQNNASTMVRMGDVFTPSNFSYAVKLQDRFSLVDTTDGSAFDSFSQTVRFGLNYDYKRLSASFLVQFAGGSAESSSGGSNLAIRKGVVKYALLKDKDQSLVFAAGREHLSSSTIYAPDALNSLYATNLGNFNMGQDGIDLYYKTKISGASVSVGAGVFNNLGAKTFTGNGYLSYASPVQSASTASGNYYNQSAVNDDRAYTFQVKGDIPFADGVIQANALYGTQDNMPMDVVYGAGVVAVNGGTANSSRDFTYWEGSAGYVSSDKALQAGVWYQDAQFGKLFIRNNSGVAESGNYRYANVARSTSYEQTTYGIGVNGTSALWGMSNLTGDNVNDVLTFGAGYQRITNVANVSSFGATGTTSPFTDPLVAGGVIQPDLDLYNVAVGFKYAALSFEVNYVQAQTTNSIFYGRDVSATNKSPQGSLIYLSSTVAL